MPKPKRKYVIGSLFVVLCVLAVISAVLEIQLDPSVYITVSETKVNGTRVIEFQVRDDVFRPKRIATVWTVEYSSILGSKFIKSASYRQVGLLSTATYSYEIPSDYVFLRGMKLEEGANKRLRVGEKNPLWVFARHNGDTISSFVKLDDKPASAWDDVGKFPPVPDIIDIGGRDVEEEVKQSD